MTRNILNAEYDAGFDFGVSSEKERIIKLLDTDGAHEWDDGHEPLTCNTCWNIALIKGENK